MRARPRGDPAGAHLLQVLGAQQSAEVRYRLLVPALCACRIARMAAAPSIQTVSLRSHVSIRPQHSSGIGQRMCGGGLPEHAPSSVPVRSTHLASQLERMLARGEGQRRRVGRVEPLRRPPRAERRAEVRRMALCGGRDRREAVTTWTASRNRQGASMSLSLSCPHRHGGGAWCGLVLVVADVSEPRVLRRQRLHSDTRFEFDVKTLAAMSPSGPVFVDSSDDEEGEEEQLHTVGGVDSTPPQEVRKLAAHPARTAQVVQCTRGAGPALRLVDASRSSPQVAAALGASCESSARRRHRARGAGTGPVAQTGG